MPLTGSVSRAEWPRLWRSQVLCLVMLLWYCLRRFWDQPMTERCQVSHHDFVSKGRQVLTMPQTFADIFLVHCNVFKNKQHIISMHYHSANIMNNCRVEHIYNLQNVHKRKWLVYFFTHYHFNHFILVVCWQGTYRNSEQETTWKR